VISQPFRPDSTVALPDRSLGDLLGEELRRLDPDEPFSDALEAATGVSGLSDRSPVREHVWFDPADPEGTDGHGNGHGSAGGSRTRKGPAGKAPAGHATARHTAPTVPADSVDADEVAEAGERDEGGTGVSRPTSTRSGAGPSRSGSPARKRP
jgi:hypothetical protein